MEKHILKISFTTPQDEFCNYIIKTIKDGYIYNDEVYKAFIETFNHYLFALLDETTLFDNYKYISSNKSYSNYDIAPGTLDDYIKQGLSLGHYKVQFDGIKDSEINYIKIDFPEYLNFQSLFGMQGKIFFKKKILKTKEIFNLEFSKVGLNKECLLYLKKVIPDDFFILNAIKNSPLKAYIDNYICITKEEALPLPVVYYTKYGILGFKTDLNEKIIYFCSCFMNAIKNYIELRLKSGKLENGIFSQGYLPQEFINYIGDKNFIINDKIFNEFQFKDSICHECNKKVPRGYYDSNNIKLKKIGWYINKRCFEYGVDTSGYILLEDKLPVYLKVLTNLDIYTGDLDVKLLHVNDRLKIYDKRKNAIYNEIENEVRNIFGFKKIGEEWVSETTLYYEIKNSFPDIDVIHHGKPKWLGKQHLDIWIPELRIAIEYQGEQHSNPVSAFGGEEAYLKNIERDKRKYELCKENNVNLIYVEKEYRLIEIIEQISSKKLR